MNRQSIQQQIDSLLKIIHDQHEQIKQHTGSIPQVEIDFMIQNLRQLYEAALLLNHTNALTSLDEVKQAITQKILAEKRAIELKKNEEQHTPVNEEVVASPVTPLTAVDVKTAETTAPENNAMNEIIAKVSGAAKEQEEKKEKPVKKKISHDLNTMYEDTPTLGDKFSNEESLHLKIASKSSSKTVGERLHKKPILDLKSGIGINEKFLFVNKLFGGNLQTYSAAIEKINSSADLTAATRVVKVELAEQFNWDEGNEHVKSFMEVVERRFGPPTINS